MIRTTNTAIAIKAIRERMVETCQLSSTLECVPIDVGCDQSDFLHEGFLLPHGAGRSRNDWAKIGGQLTSGRRRGRLRKWQNVGY